MLRGRFLILGIMFSAGCEQAIPPEELGQAVYEVPMVPGAEEPYPIPELRTPTEGNAENDPK